MSGLKPVPLLGSEDQLSSLAICELHQPNGVNSDVKILHENDSLFILFPVLFGGVLGRS